MGLDTIYISFYKGYWFFNITCCDLSGWVEAKSLCTFSFRVVVDFLWKDVIYYYGCFRKLVINRGLENKNIVTKLAKRYELTKVVIFVYYSQVNEIIKCGHNPIFNAFSKIFAEESTNWVSNLLAILWANWLNVHLSTDFTLYYICYKSKSVFTIKLKVFTWQILAWDKVYLTANLLAIYAHQLQYQDNNFEEVIFHFQCI